MNRRSRLLVMSCLAVVAACAERVHGLEPVGGAEASRAARERYLRRLVLDLTGKAATDAEVRAAIDRLDAEGDVAAVRLELADDLIATRDFAATYVAELENRAFAGERPEARYQLLCAVYRNNVPACQACPPPTDGDLCGGCDCPLVAAVYADRALVGAAVEDLAAGAPTSEVDRRYAESYAFKLGGADATATALWTAFLGRLPGPEELRNARMIVFGALDGTSPAGLIFHRHGSTYADLVDIVLESEAYREAVVAGAFQRYLGRDPTPVELAHFVKRLDPEAPDARVVIRAVVASREYATQ